MGALVACVMAACSTQHDVVDPDAGVPGDLQACDVSPECIVVPESCCGSCGAATRGDAIAVNVDRADVYRTVVCEGTGACPACFLQQDPTLVATCLAGQCAVVDLEDHPVTECEHDDDCRVRTRDCCECGGDTSPAGLIALRVGEAEQQYADLVCDPDDPCPECAPLLPEDATAFCSSAGRCVVEWAVNGG
jgi:hypothetical protein